jgi:hypothetical protein
MRLGIPVGVVALGIGFWLATSTAAAGQISWKCQAQPVETCAKRHGRLSSQNGVALKIWLTGTTRMVGLENDFEDLPQLVQKYLDMTSANHSNIFGDFDICPLEPDTPGHLRRACVVGAEKLVVQPLRSSRPPFRLLSTWPADGGEPKNAIQRVP